MIYMPFSFIGSGKTNMMASCRRSKSCCFSDEFELLEYENHMRQTAIQQNHQVGLKIFISFILT